MNTQVESLPKAQEDPTSRDHPREVVLLLNVGHALDHLFLLIFATAVGTIAAEFGFARWEDLMPYGVGAFFLFGLGSVPAGRLGDLWGRRQMMLRSEEHTSELQSRENLVCRLLLEKKK